MKNKRFAIIMATAVLFLSILLIVMQFINDVDWNILDFAIAGFLLFGSGLFGELLKRAVKSFQYRIIIFG